MKPLIFIIEDDVESANNLKSILELNDYATEIAFNGKEAHEKLEELKSLPDLIICDIIMPEMNGYDFYVKVSENSSWSRIPFFFLSGKIETEDVRFGKLLGADDYITKPFNIKDLLTRIDKKIKENLENLLASQMIEGKLIKFWKLKDPSLFKMDKLKFLYLFYLTWDDEIGPKIVDFYPKNEIPSLKLKEITSELYSTLINVYEYKKVFKSNKYVFRIVKGLIDAYILIDRIEGKEPEKKGVGTVLLCAIAPNFHYLITERIKETLGNLVNKLKKGKNLDMKEEWEAFLKIYQDNE